MKTETQIAIKNLSKDIKSFWGWVCLEHKATCQRFLDFLKLHNEGLKVVYEKIKGLGEFNQWQNMENKITDLKQAIKLYEDAGI